MATLVQTSTNFRFVTSTGGNGSITPSSGNALIVVGNGQSGANRTLALSDDKGNTWSTAVFRYGSTTSLGTAGIWYATNVAAGATSVRISVVGDLLETCDWKILEVSGLDPAPFDVASARENSTNSTAQTCAIDGTVIDTAPNVMIVTASILNVSGGANVPGSGYLTLNSTLDLVFWQYQITASSLTNEQGAWSHDASARQSVNVIASFKDATAGTASARGIGRMLMGIGR